MKWFKHFTRAHNDKAIEKLIIEFGIAGYGVYFYCLELIAGTLDVENITFELEPDASILAHRLSMDTILVEKIMKRIIDLKLFESSADGRITCLKLGKYLESGQTNNPEIRKIIKGFRENKSEIISDNLGSSEIISDNSHHIRLDKINININSPSKTESTSEEIDRLFPLDPESASGSVSVHPDRPASGEAVGSVPPSKPLQEKPPVKAKKEQYTDEQKDLARRIEKWFLKPEGTEFPPGTIPKERACILQIVKRLKTKDNVNRYLQTFESLVDREILRVPIFPSSLLTAWVWAKVHAEVIGAA